MVGVEEKILELFRKNTSAKLTTWQILTAIDEKAAQIEEILKSPLYGKTEKKLALREKAKLHRRVLYYLNKLIRSNLLATYGEVGKGEKIFGLNLTSGEEITIEGIRKIKITISRPPFPSLPVEGYEQRGVLRKYEEGTWINRVNSILVEGSNHPKLSTLYNYISNCILLVNDCLYIRDFERFLEKEKDEIFNFFREISNLINDFGKRIIFSIDFSKIQKKHEKKLENIVKYCNSLQQRPNFVFKVNPNEIYEKLEIFSKIIENFSSSGEPLTLQNSIFRAPYFRGICGVYGFDESEWRVYEEYSKKMSSIVCSNFTIALDMAKFASEFRLRVSSLEEVVKKCCEAMLIGSSIQREKIQEYFKFLLNTNKECLGFVFGFSRNYLRIWNYEWLRKRFDDEVMLSVLERIRKCLNNFCSIEETIYKACGMPIRFRVVLAQAIYEYYRKFFTEPEWERIELRHLGDLYESPSIKSKLVLAEKVGRMLNGGAILELYKLGKLNLDEACRELSYVLTTYRFPIIYLDFSGVLRRDLKLLEFLR